MEVVEDLVSSVMKMKKWTYQILGFFFSIHVKACNSIINLNMRKMLQFLKLVIAYKACTFFSVHACW